MSFSTTRLRFLCSEPLKYGANAAAQFDDPDWPRFVRITDITDDGRLKDETFRSLPPEEAEPYLLEEGDLLLARSGSIGRSFIYKHEWGTVCHAGYLIRARLTDKFHPRYVYWALNTTDYWAWIEGIAIRSTIQNVSAEKYADFQVPSPPLETQKRIAAFLDEKTAQIDGLIEKKRALLSRLVEKRQAIITLAVTKGLNPAAPMKDSGIAWLGDIPAHWKLAALSHRYEVQLGRMLNAERAEGDNLKPYLRVYDVQWSSIAVADLPLMDFPPDAQRRYRLIPGDLLVNEGGSYVGRSAIWDGQLEECYYQKALHRLRPIDKQSDMAAFLLLLMEAAVNQGVFVAGGNQTTIDHLTAEQLKRYRFGFPPVGEQYEIVENCRKQLDYISGVSAKVTKSFERLQEYRSALITAAVTGQIEGLR